VLRDLEVLRVTRGLRDLEELLVLQVPKVLRIQIL